MTSVEMLGFLTLVLVGFALSAVYSGLETGFYTINRVRLTVLAAGGERSAIRVRQMVQDAPRTLAVILVGNNTANYLATYGLAELMHETGLSDWGLIAVEVAVVTPLLFVFAETLPKDLFCTHTDRWTYWLSPVITVSRVMFTITLLMPGVSLVTYVTTRLLHGHARDPVTARQRISQLLREGVGAGVLSPAQAALTDRALTLRTQRVDRVMVPWRTVVALPLGAGERARETLIRRNAFTRFPVVDENGRVRGIFAWTDLVIGPGRATGDLMHAHVAMPPGTHVLTALDAMRRQRQPMAVVEDPATGRPLGIVTMKDLVEPLTGELAVW